MRSKKVIVVVDGDEERLSVTRFALELHGFRVIGCGDETLVRDLRGVNVATVFHPQRTRRLAEMARDVCCKTLAIGEYDESEATHVDRWLSKPTMAELTETLKVLAQRKRGPRAPERKQPTPDLRMILADPEMQSAVVA